MVIHHAGPIRRSLQCTACSVLDWVLEANGIPGFKVQMRPFHRTAHKTSRLFPSRSSWSSTVMNIRFHFCWAWIPFHSSMKIRRGLWVQNIEIEHFSLAPCWCISNILAVNIFSAIPQTLFKGSWLRINPQRAFRSRIMSSEWLETLNVRLQGPKCC